MVEQIKLVYKLKGFDTKFFLIISEKILQKKSTFNFASNSINYYENR